MTPYYYLACIYHDGSEQIVSISLPEITILPFIQHLMEMGKLKPNEPITLIEDF